MKLSIFNRTKTNSKQAKQFKSFIPPNDSEEVTIAARKHSEKMYNLHKTLVEQFNPEDIDTSLVDDTPLNSIEKYFLKYLDKKDVNNLDIAVYWTYEYNINYKKLITKFIINGYIEISTHSLNSCNVSELKEILKDNRLPVTGIKDDLLYRIYTNVPDIEKYPKTTRPTFQLTEKGVKITKDLLPSATKNTDLEDSCINLIKDLNFNLAYKKICLFELEKNISQRPNLDFKKEIENGLSEAKLTSFHQFMNFDFDFIPDEQKQYEIDMKAVLILCNMLNIDIKGAYNTYFRITKDKYNKGLTILTLSQMWEYFTKYYNHILNI